MDRLLLSYRDVKGLILDWDGVIADTKLDFTVIRNQFFGGRPVPLIKSLDSLPPEEARQARDAIEAEELRGAEEARAVPGALEFLRWLGDEKLPWCVLSLNSGCALERAACSIGLALPPVTISREGPYMKPDGRAMTDAAHQLGLAPSDCLAVGDFLFDLLAARRASMRVVLVEQQNAPWANLADAAYPHMTDFTKAFMEGQSFVPWEYHGNTLRDSHEVLFDLSTLQGWQNLEECFASGVTELALPQRPLSLEEWRACVGLPLRFLHEPLYQVVQDFFKARYPLLSVSACQENQL